jgi:hypothetical protein
VKEYAYAKGIYPPVPESDDSSSESEEEEIDEDDEDDEISDNEEEENSMEETTEASFAPQQQEVKEGETSIASTSTVPAPGPSLQAVLAKEAMAPGAKAMPAARADHHPGRGHRPERRAAAASAAESIVGSGSGNSSSCNTASTTAQPFSPDLVSFRALPSLSKKHAPNNNGSAKSGVSQSQPEMGGVSDPLTCDWHGLWQGLMKMGWQKVPVQGYTLPASDLAPAICVGKTEVDVREWLSDGREMLVADWALLWAHLEKIGWKRQTQKGIAHCSSVYCVPGGSGGGPENVEWFRTSFLVRKRLHAYPELLLDWGQVSCAQVCIHVWAPCQKMKASVDIITASQCVSFCLLAFSLSLSLSLCAMFFFCAFAHLRAWMFRCGCASELTAGTTRTAKASLHSSIALLAATAAAAAVP